MLYFHILVSYCGFTLWFYVVVLCFGFMCVSCCPCLLIMSVLNVLNANNKANCRHTARLWLHMRARSHFLCLYISKSLTGMQVVFMANETDKLRCKISTFFEQYADNFAALASYRRSLSRIFSKSNCNISHDTRFMVATTKYSMRVIVMVNRITVTERICALMFAVSAQLLKCMRSCFSVF